MGELELRISDQDRERAATVLHAAVGEGRLTWFEHEERVRGVYAARTGAELEPWLADLPAARSAVPMTTRPTAPAVAPESAPLRVMLSKVRRRPDPGVGQLYVEATLGAAVLDLRELPAGCFIDVVADSVLGKVEIYVSPGTRLIDIGTATLGKRSVVEHGRHRGTPLRPDSPVVRVAGHSSLGHVRVTIG
ncbi:DUF1707 SHOCT-like domain-containing protein [Pseudonocardia sp. GCM10023141]|uniref:DUF1707 SHOCT-like domain-containing protein n=1 Tax=Pseudonocardia sp. GCM10023141 TaxID=3252653 RepID=UPI003616D256